MPETDPFGNRYYGQEEFKAERRPEKTTDTHEEARLQKLLDEDVPDQVRRTVKRWNQTLREFISKEKYDEPSKMGTRPFGSYIPS
jgi:hypothetical protein